MPSNLAHNAAMALRDLNSDVSDLDLVAAWQAGDQRAATQLVERHADAVARYVASLGTRRGVEEIVQDTFVRAFHNLAGFRGESALRTWLFTIARHLVADARRAIKRQRQLLPVEEGDAATEYDALDELVAGEARQRLAGVIQRLTPTQREVFVLRITEGLSYKEIAAVVGTTEGAARVHYHNALRHVKEELHV